MIEHLTNYGLWECGIRFEIVKECLCYKGGVNVSPDATSGADTEGKKMRKIISIICIIWVMLVAGFLSPFSTQAEEKTIASKIVSVTAYSDSAFVTREANVDVSVGQMSVILDDIVTNFDENSLRVSGQGTAAVKIFGAQVKKEYLPQSSDARVKELENKVEEFQDQINRENAQQGILNEQKEFLNSVKSFSGQQIPKDLVTKMLSVTDMESTFNFLTTQLTNIDDQQRESWLKIRDLQRQKEVFDQELAQLRNTQNKMKRSVVIDLECTKAGKLTLEISYLANGVSWQPLYDARTALDKGEVELTAFGVIRQATGEDWKDVDLTLSTARPAIGGRMPYVAPWILQPFQAQPEVTRSSGDFWAKGRAAGVLLQSAAFDAKSDQVAPAPRPAEVVYTQAQERGVSVTYKIARKVNIKSDGSEQKLPVSTQTLKANFEYSSFPKATPFAYLGSRVTNAADLQLLGGPVNLFLEGDFVGSSSIDNISPGEDFDLYLGVDENVKIKREQISRKMDDVLIGGIPSPNKVTTFKYKLSVENQKNKNIRVILFETIPVSENERIRVKVSDVSAQPKEKDWKDRKGVWRWELELSPKAKQEIFYTFIVEHPRDMQVSGI